MIDLKRNGRDPRRTAWRHRRRWGDEIRDRRKPHTGRNQRASEGVDLAQKKEKEARREIYLQIRKFPSRRETAGEEIRKAPNLWENQGLSISKCIDFLIIGSMLRYQMLRKRRD